MKDYEQILSTLLAKIAEQEKVVISQAARIAELEKHHKGETLKQVESPDNVDRLVYYEIAASIKVAIEREKHIKGWSRKKKHDLINVMNPEWNDLYLSLL